MLALRSEVVELSDNSQVVITRITGNINSSTVQQFEERVQTLYTENTQIIFTFTEVTGMNSTALGTLVKLADKYESGDIKLVDLPDKAVSLFDMLGLLSLFKIYKTEEQALRSFGKGLSLKKSPPQKKLLSPPPSVPPI